MPIVVHAQPSDMLGFQEVLDNLYDEMLPLCSQLIAVGRGIAGFAALWYISVRVWRHIANAESIDFYPLLRPFVLGFCIVSFPSVIALINGVLKPTVAGTSAMVEGSRSSIAFLLKKKEEAIMKSPMWQIYVGSDGGGSFEKWYEYTYGEEDNALPNGLGDHMRFAMEKASYSFRNTIKQWMSEVLHILYEAASLCINTIRTFYLIVLAIVGPLVFGFAVFDGFHNSLTMWLARYINIFLWLPVANIFGSIIGKIQENMLKIDVAQIERYGDTFFSTADTAYLVFLVIGIVGYFTVPSIASYIVHAGSGGNYLTYKLSNLSYSTARTTFSSASTVASTVSGALTARGPEETKSDNPNEKSGYMKEKISGQ
ncbi:conjugative transposon protein TraJ [Pseudochryseolinea flava]|nr:conjugative transposon protein TraJ [Pseudochryseolinea flava]